ncbi:Oxoglutarate/iron-dependent dioxygenase [Corchorus olitorius]|uniref:Oxoglutarate/iron-dependent dioxygenase n=1 Tax=Corchorus olitorius TaxID=93759 RepID=A0A1R3JPY0_9ROSI|nr:Oxoglutarate/iron-dependent dioxygenase [Corchorus olitorius]
MGWGKSLKVPSIQEIVRNDSKSIPERFIQEEKERPKLVSDSPEIPVIDFSLLARGDEDERRKLDLACKEWGFFQIKNHGIAKEVLDHIKTAAETFFELPIEEKNKYSMAENDIQGFGQVYVVSEEQKLDWNDMIYLKTLPVEIRNFKFWPLSCPGFKEALENYSMEIMKVAAEIYANLSVLMGLDRDGLIKLQGELKQGIRMNYYPTCSRPDLVLGMSPHSDGGALTLLLQDDQVTGLQIKHKESWVNVKPIPDSLVVNIGDAIEILSNGVYKSIEHRVITNEKKERISIAAFVNPDEHQEIGPLESMVNDELHRPRMYRKIKYIDYIRQVLTMKLQGKAHTDIVKLEIKLNLYLPILDT